MNILLINKFYFQKGGAEKYFFDLKKLLEDKGNTVVLFAMQHKKNLKTKYNKYFVSEIKTKPSKNIFKNLKTICRFWWSLEARRKIKKLLLNNKINIAHLNNIYHQISPSILPIFKKHKIPVVMTVHDYSLVSPNYNMFLNGKIYDKICGKKYYKCLFDKCVNKSFVQSLISVIEMYLHHKILNVYKKNIDIFIAPSRFVEKKLLDAGFDKNKIKLLPHFIDCNETALPSYKASDYILYFGRLSAEKGIDFLVDVMQYLPNIKLKVVGQGPLEEKIKLQIKSYNLNNIELMGYKSGNELENIIKNSNFVVAPSLSPETFGLNILESQVLGKIVIASNIGALPELVEKKFLFEPGKLEDIINKIKSLTKIKKNDILDSYEIAEKVRKKHNPELYYKKLLEIYNL